MLKYKCYMKKFWTVFLKVIVFLSVVCAVCFVAIVIIKNSNSTFEAYNYVTAKKTEVNFNTYIDKFDNEIKLNVDATDDEYVELLSGYIKDLNGQIDYYIDYLSTLNKLTKGEQTRLVEGYKNYVAKFNSAYSAYEAYLIPYNEAKANPSEVNLTARNFVVNCEKTFVDRYVECFNAGNDFLNTLVGTINKNLYGNKTNLSFKYLSGRIEMQIAKFAVDDIYTAERKEIGTNKFAEYYTQFLSRKNTVLTTSALVDDELNSFVVGMQKFDFAKTLSAIFEGGSLSNTSYYATLSNENKLLLQEVRDFYVDNFVEVA